MTEFIGLTAGFAALALIGLHLLTPSAAARRVQALAAVRASRPPRERRPTLGPFFQGVIQRAAFGRKLEGLLSRAEVALSESEFLGLTLLLALGFGLLAQLFTRSLPMAMLGALMGAYAPWLYLSARCRLRLRAFNEQLPDALLLLVNALRSGNGIRQALQLVATQMPAPASTEFQLVIQETNWGISLDQALANLHARIGSTDVELLATAISIHHETGGKLSEILSNLHDTLRDRLRLEGEVRTLTAQGRLSGWILGLLPIALAMVFLVISPTYLRMLLEDPRGQLMVAYALLMEVTGAFFITRLVRVRF